MARHGFPLLLLVCHLLGGVFGYSVQTVTPSCLLVERGEACEPRNSAEAALIQEIYSFQERYEQIRQGTLVQRENALVSMLAECISLNRGLLAAGNEMRSAMNGGADAGGYLGTGYQLIHEEYQQAQTKLRLISGQCYDNFQNEWQQYGSEMQMRMIDAQ